MTSRSARFEMAYLKAGEILNEESLPVDPFEIAKRHDILVEPKPDTFDGVSGMLLRHGNAFGILYATKISSEGFQRFSVAHELGHYFLEGHIDHIFPFGQNAHSSSAGFASGDPYEQEADHFAVGILMPRRLFKNAMLKYHSGLTAIESLAELCKTSLTSTAIRYAELCEEPVAVIMSTGGKVNYCFLSEAMKTLRDLSWPTKGSEIPQNTGTFEFNSDLDRISKSERAGTEIDIIDWLGGKRSIPTTEEIVGLGSYGKTLTVLTCDLDEDESYLDENEDDDLIESWTPRFHR